MTPLIDKYAKMMEKLMRRAFALAPRGLRQLVHLHRMRRNSRRNAQRNAARVLEGHRLVPEGALEEKYRDTLRLLQERGCQLGDYLEFGVYNGSSLSCMHRALDAAGAKHVRLFGFDSFAGLPLEARHDDGGVWRPGQFSIDYDFTRRFLTEQGVDWSRVHLVKGWFSKSLTPELVQRHGIEKASVIMVDCDMYLSAKTALTFCAPLIRDTAVILFDDWYAGGLAAKNMGERRAFREFMEEHAEFSAEEFGSYNSNSQVMIVTRSTK